MQGTQALWRSTDDGESWKLVWPSPSKIRDVRMSSDHADETIVSDSNSMGEIVALAIDPADSHTLVAGSVKEGKAALFFSTDAGEHWERVRDLPAAPQRIWIDPHSSNSDRDIYIGREERGSRFDVTGSGRIGLRLKVSFTDISAGFSATQGIMLYAASRTREYFCQETAVSRGFLLLFPVAVQRCVPIATSLNHPEICLCLV